MANKIIQHQQFNSIDDFLKAISYGGDLYQLFQTGYFAFRGHASDKYQLIPTALRLESKDRFNKLSLSATNINEDDLEYFQIFKESQILRDFYKLCDKNGLLIEEIKRIRNSILETIDLQTIATPEKWIPTELWSLASLAQHYGVPTRLLDWTHDINVALFFAIENYLEGIQPPVGTNHIVLWALNLQLVSIPNVLELPLKLIQPTYYGNSNLSAQKGLFTLWQVDKNVEIKDGRIVPDMETKVNRSPLDQLLQTLDLRQNVNGKSYLYEIKLPMDSAMDIYKHIKFLGYDASRIYPGYHGVMKSMMHDYPLNADKINSIGTIMRMRK